MSVTAAYHLWTGKPGESAKVTLVEFSSVDEAKSASMPDNLVAAFIFVEHGYHHRGKTTGWDFTDYS